MPVRKTVEHLTLGDIPIPDPIARNGPDSPDGQNEQDGLDPQERPSGYGFEGEVTVTWEKVLWRKQPFPDNYVPPTFLAELNALPPRPRPRFSTLVFGALPISQHLAVIALFLAVFWGLLDGQFGAGQVGWTCVGLGVVGYGIRSWGWGVGTSVKDPYSPLPPPTSFRSLLLPPLLLALLSPVLGTLTSATTSDTIWPLAGGLFFVHLLLSDFSTGKDARLRRWKRQQRQAEQRKRRSSLSQYDTPLEEKSLTSSLSLTSALSASVVLASRLPSTAHVFSLVLLSVGLFAGWPVLAKGVRESGKTFSSMLTASMIILAISIFPAPGPAPVTATDSTHSPSFSLWTDDFSTPILVFGILVLLVNVIGPLMLWYSWRWKMRRGGGWEVAKVRLRRTRPGQG